MRQDGGVLEGEKGSFEQDQFEWVLLYVWEGVAVSVYGKEGL